MKKCKPYCKRLDQDLICIKCGKKLNPDDMNKRTMLEGKHKEAPSKGEHWHVQYGADVKMNILVKVLQDEKELGCYKCDRKGEEILVQPDCFVERFAPKQRTFSNPNRPYTPNH